MTDILLVETASPKRVRKRAEEILAGTEFTNPRVTIACSDDPKTVEYFGVVPGATVIPLQDVRRGQRFDLLYIFWTGEKRYRRMKWSSLRLKAASTIVDIGDGGKFRLTWKAWVRHSIFRFLHPLPTDHWELVPRVEEPVACAYYQGERILIVQSAGPVYVLRALEHLGRTRLFRDPRYTLFCRNGPEITKSFAGHPMLHSIRTHSETRNALRHILALRRERYDGAVVFFTGDPSYWKIKYLPFLLGVRHKLIFNEGGDCFFFSVTSWLSLLAHRLGERSRLGGQPRWTHQARLILFMITKAVLLPLRFVWLLGVWLWLRTCAIAGAGSR